MSEIASSCVKPLVAIRKRLILRNAALRARSTDDVAQIARRASGPRSWRSLVKEKPWTSHSAWISGSGFAQLHERRAAEVGSLVANELDDAWEGTLDRRPACPAVALARVQVAHGQERALYGDRAGRGCALAEDRLRSAARRQRPPRGW